MIKNYRGWLNESQDYRHLLTREQIDWCDKHIIQEWWVNAAGEVEVEKDLTTKNDSGIVEFPVQFANVKGSFNCRGATNLKSLKGAPTQVDGNFSCWGSKNLETLEGASQRVGGDFYCFGCTSLESLKGAPQWVGSDFLCDSCTKLKTLRGISAKIEGKIFYEKCPLLPQEEIDLLEEDKDLFLKWAQTEMSVDEFRAKYKGELKGKKFGI